VRAAPGCGVLRLSFSLALLPSCCVRTAIGVLEVVLACSPAVLLAALPSAVAAGASFGVVGAQFGGDPATAAAGMTAGTLAVWGGPLCGALQAGHVSGAECATHKATRTTVRTRNVGTYSWAGKATHVFWMCPVCARLNCAPTAVASGQVTPQCQGTGHITRESQIAVAEKGRPCGNEAGRTTNRN